MKSNAYCTLIYRDAFLVTLLLLQKTFSDNMQINIRFERQHLYWDTTKANYITMLLAVCITNLNSMHRMCYSRKT